MRRSRYQAIEGVFVVCIHKEEGCVEEAVCHDNEEMEHGTVVQVQVQTKSRTKE